MTEYTVITTDFVNVSITTSKSNVSCIERRFKKGITIEDLKNKLELLTGGSAATMKLQVYNKDDKLVCNLDNNAALLGSYPIDDGMRLHVVDNFVLDSTFEDIKNVEKFELSEEKYSQRADTVKAFMERNKIGKYNEEEMRKKEEQRKKEEEEDEQMAKLMNVGDRCEVSVPGQPVRRGTVMFVGKVQFKPGWWIGIKYDEPHGKNDGSVQGVKYFECAPKYGGFVKPNAVKVGDFPEEMDIDEM